MGENAAQTVREIEDTRARLESEFRELEGRLPAPAVWAKRTIGVAVGGGMAGTALLFGLKRIRSRRRKKKERAAQQVQAVVQVLPERWAGSVSKALESEQLKGCAIIAGSAWLLFRLAELRQMRRMNRALLTAR
jgi:hypothetical protein